MLNLSFPPFWNCWGHSSLKLLKTSDRRPQWSRSWFSSLKGTCTVVILKRKKWRRSLALTLVLILLIIGSNLSKSLYKGQLLINWWSKKSQFTANYRRPLTPANIQLTNYWSKLHYQEWNQKSVKFKLHTENPTVWTSQSAKSCKTSRSHLTRPLLLSSSWNQRPS